jgi:hypothetical protein
MGTDSFTSIRVSEEVREEIYKWKCRLYKKNTDATLRYILNRFLNNFDEQDNKD